MVKSQIESYRLIVVRNQPDRLRIAILATPWKEHWTINLRESEIEQLRMKDIEIEIVPPKEEQISELLDNYHECKMFVKTYDKAIELWDDFIIPQLMMDEMTKER